MKKLILLLLLCISSFAGYSQTYCTPSFSGAHYSCTYYGMHITGFAATGVSSSISDGAACNGSGYLDRTSLSCTMYMGNTYTVTVSTGSSYGMAGQIWIDFNYDGTFDASESVGGFGSSSGASTHVVTITLPGGVYPGNRRMRVAVNDYNYGGAHYPSISPCGGYYYGEDRDYTINVATPPPAASFTPSSLTFAATTAGTTSSTMNTVLNASYLSTSTGSLTITAPTNFSVFDGSSWSPSYTISFSGSGVSAVTVPVQFNAPSTTGTYTGSVCVTGGGLSSAVCASVSGVSAAACSGTPTAGSAAVTPTTGSTATVFTLTESGFSTTGGITFQWQSSPDGTTWTNISGATTSTYTGYTGMAVNTYFQCIVTCTASGLSSTGTSTMATWTIPSSSCTPAFANSCSSFPMTTRIGHLVGGSGSITDATSCTSSSYEDYSASLGCTLYRSLSYTVTVNTSTTYYSSFNTQIWIDYNNNGTFESSESVGGTGYVSSSTPTTTITIPSGAATGPHRMRIVGNYECCGASTYPSINPCPTSSISYGDCRDYYVILTDPPPSGTATPNTLNFGTISAGATSATLNSVLTAAYLSPSSGNLTVTAPTNFAVYDAGSSTFTTSTTIAYTGSALSATTLQYQFNAPSTVGVYSGVSNITGGGIASAVTVTLNGTSATACTGSPTTGTASASPAAGTSATTFTFSLAGTSIGLGLSFQWQSSTTSGGTYTNISGATNATYTVSGLSSIRYYRCQVTCSYSATTSTSNVVGVPIYCVPAFANPCSSYPMSASIGTLNGASSTSINDGSACTSSSYEDMTSLSCILTAGVTYTATMALSSSYYPSFSLQMWIDYNDDGTFASSESIGGGGSFGSSTPTISLAIPTTATVGTHRMRLVNDYQCCGNTTYPTINPCPTTSTSYGDARDYQVTIAPPPPVATLTPGSVTFPPTTVGSSSSASNLTLNASYLVASSGNLTVTSSNSNFQVYNGSSWVSSYTISYTGGTVSAGTVAVQFTPGSAGTFSGTICVTGGSLASAVCTSVSGTGASACSGTPTAGTAAVTPTTGSGGTSFTLSLTGYSASGGVGFQWQSRNPSGSGTWTNITGATTAPYTFTGISSSTDYQCIVTCSYSGLSATSNAVTATWVLPASSCTPSFAQPCSSYPMTSSIGVLVGSASTSITDHSGCTSSSYEDFSGSLVCTLYRSFTYNATLDVATSYYSSFHDQVWIDFNDNGTFETSESVGGVNNPSTSNPVVALSIGSTVGTGYHRMRIVGNYGCCGYGSYPSINPCPTSSISYGDVRDYKVLVQDPPPYGSTTPTSLNFGTIATSSTSSTLNTAVSAFYLTPTSGLLTVTASANFSVYNGSSWVSSYSISYSGATVTSVTIPVQFNAPSTPGSYSGTVCVSGGGLSTAICTSVSGISANPCSGTPTGGSALISPAAGTSSTTFNLSLSGATIVGLGLSYQWQSSSTVGGTYTNISGATNTTYSVSGLSAATYFRCVVSCSYSGLSANSSPIGCAVYCLPAFAQPCSSYPMSASIGHLNGYSGSIADASACTSTSYEDMTSLSCVLQAGASYVTTLNLSCSYYPSFSLQVWIDYNDDGTFASSESVGGGGSFSSCTSSTITLALPTSANPGTHRMRLVNNYQCCGNGTYPTINPCPTTSISYGDARDYMVNIIPPPPAATMTPSSIAFPPTLVSATSSPANITLTASYLVPSTGSLTVTSSNSNFLVFDPGSSTWVSSYIISYTGATVSATTVQVEFAPGSIGSFTGTICVTGGSLASAVCTNVSGTGATACSGTPTAGTASVTPSTGSGGTSFTLSVTGYTASGGIGFQWQSRNPSGTGSWVNISGATLSSYTFTGIASSTDYQCIVTCSYSSTSATTSPVTATWVLPPSSCTPSFANPCSSYPMYTRIGSLIGGSGSIADANNCTSAGYEDYSSSMGCTLYRSLTYGVTMNTSSTYYSNFNTQVWIDFNDNGTFESSESMCGTGYVSSPSPTTSMTIPSGATLGMHRMRSVGNYECCGASTYPSINPCPTSSISYGDARDYYVIIQDPPPMASATPTSLSFGTIAASTTSSTLNTVLTGSYLTPTSGALTVTASSNFNVNNGSSWVSSYSISYSSATVSATTIPVQFVAPSTVGVYTGTVTISGGGLSTPVVVNLNGTSANACSGTPTAGTTVATPSAGTSATTFTLSLSGSAIGLGLSYQWYSSTTGTGGWSSISGATNATYTFSGLTSSLYYYCLVSCSYSGLSQFSSVQRISSYCVPAFANPCSSYPMNASIGHLVGVSGSISDASSCTSSSYEDMTSLSCSLQAGASYVTTLNLSCSYYPSFSLQVWIDYNDDGTFASSETVGGGGSFSSCTSSTITLAIPSSATIGTHRMRLVNNYQCCGNGTYPTINPCPTTSISYGDARDYTVNITPPPPAATLAPTSITFPPTTTGTASATSNFILNASYLVASTGSLTVTSSNSNFLVYDPGSATWVSSYLISYTGATVSAATIAVQFYPATAGTFSGTICVTGGSLASAVCASVNGTGASPCSGTPTAGTASITPSTGSGGTSFTLSVTGYTVAGGIGFQWQSSPAGAGTWSNITGATTSSYTFTGISSSTDYRCVVSCSYSGLTANTNTTTATWTLPPSSCTPTFSSASLACSTYNMYMRMSVTGTAGSIADATACTGSGWEDLTSSTSVTFLTGNTFTATFNTGSTYYGSMTAQAWIDYNDDGSFASSESVGGYNFFSSPSQSVSLVIPSSATPGAHRMRIVGNYACCGYSSYPSMNPCPTTSITYGDCRDYKVIIIAPVACSGTPSAGGVSASPTVGCSPVSTSMYPTAAVGVTGLTYQWQSSSTSGGTYTSISGATGFTYSPTVATNTYYQCVLTCTASGSSATSSNQLITANPAGGAFSGTPNACAGSSSTLSNAVSGGTWSSSNTSIATVDPTSGVVTGIAPGTCTINYTTSGCSAVGQSWTTNANPGTTSGTASACVGASQTLTNTIPGGTWSSSDTTIATVAGTSGSCVVTGTGAGTCTITYSTGCGTPTTTSWTTNSTPSAIAGLASVCTASVNTFTDAVSGGSWSVSGSATGTTIDGGGNLYTGTTTGTETITYAIGSCSITTTVAVGNSGPSSISGSTSVCALGTTTLTDAVTGGAWTSTDPTIASIGFSSGIVTGVGSGSVTITYSTGCGSPVTASMTVNGSPVTITAPTVCSGNTLTMTATTGTGSYTYSWSGPSGFTSTVASPTISTAATTASGIYSVSATQSGCTTSTSYWVSVDPTPSVTVTASPASICPGGTSNLSATVTSPASGSSNYTVMAIPYTPYTITSPSSGPSGDDVSSSVSIPFTFNFYGTGYTSVNICTNGFVNFGSASTSYVPATLPSASQPSGIVAPFYHDFNGSGITYGTVGTAPNRKFIVNYNAYHDYSGSGVNTGQVVFYETSNVIEMFISQSNTGGSYSQVCGIQNIAGTSAVTVPGENYTNYTINNTVAGTGWRFERPSYSYSWSPATSLSATNIAAPVSTGLSSTQSFSVTSIDAYSGCTTGNTSSTSVNVYTLPTAYTMSPANGCSVGTAITLPSSQTGVNYQLYIGGTTPVGSAVAGTGSSISFGTVTTSGTYTIVGTLATGGCQTTMTGTTVVTNSPNAYAVTGGSGCASTGVAIGLAGSDGSSVSYQLYNGASTSGSPVTGSGSSLSFGTLTAAGTYTVVATSTAGCATTMTGSATVNPSPTVYNVTGGNGCTATGVTVGTSNSETGVSYQMYLSGSASGSPVSGSTGSGVTFGLQSAAGNYAVIASLGGCADTMNGGDTIVATPSVVIGANPSVCQPTSSTSISYSSPSGSPTTYNITWGSTAITDGFTNVTGGTLSGGVISITIPTGAANSYTGTITVSNGSCTSSSYSFTVNVYAQPYGSITSATAPCVGYSSNIIFSGPSGQTADYSIDGGSPVSVTLTGGTYTLATGVISGTHTYELLNVHNPVCTAIIDTTVSITPNPMQWVGGTSGVETDWNTTTNWSCGFIPTASDDVTIPSGTTYSPVIGASASGTTHSLTIASGATVTVSSAATLNVKGDLSNNGTVTGVGSTSLNGSSAQNISGFGIVNNFELNNSAGATVSSGARLTIKGGLTVTSGNLATGDSVVLWSDSLGTAQLKQMPSSGSSITGNTKVMQWIAGGRRAYRFWAHPFSNNIDLSQVENYIDVTGAGGSANGFTTTASNAPSAYRYDPTVGNSGLPSDPGWRPYTSAYGTADSNKIHQYQGIRLFFRGAKGEGLYYGSYTPSSVSVAQWGLLNQGPQTISLSKGSGTNQDYNMVGNPYASPVDVGTAVYNAKVAGHLTGSTYYLWNPFAGSAGAFIHQAIASSSATAPLYIQANNCFQVEAAYNGATLFFDESYKSDTASQDLLKGSNNDLNEFVVYDGNYHMWEMFEVRFNDKATTTSADANYDSKKPSSPAALNLYSLSSDGVKMGTDGRPYKAGEVIPLGIQSDVAQDFIIKAESISVPTGGSLYLHDKLLKQYILLQQGTEYRFSITADKATQGENRFELSMAPANVANNKGLAVTMTPNPATDEVAIGFSNGKAEAVSLRILDLSGVSVYNQDLGIQQNGNVSVQLSSFASGIYMVELTSGNQKVVQRLVKE